VTTYQAGKLVMVRDDGDHLNTHFRSFQAPMGLALDGARLAVGTTTQVWEFVDTPAVAAKRDARGRHDACFLPRPSHVTGNIQGHEMAWGKGGELWVVNTRFSCLCTIEKSASFAPRWRPPFVSALDLASGQMVAPLRFDAAVQENFAVTVLPGLRWPELINDDETLLENSFVVPDAALADVPAALRAPVVRATFSAELGNGRSEVCARACG
jgi:hypothetical protein